MTTVKVFLGALSVMALMIMGSMAQAQGQLCTNISDITVSAEHVVVQIDGSYIIVNPTYTFLGKTAYFIYIHDNNSAAHQRLGICKHFGFSEPVPRGAYSTIQVEGEAYQVEVDGDGRLVG
jgi:hypothetical protein